MSKFEESFQKALRATDRKAAKKVIVQRGQYLNEPAEYRAIQESSAGVQASGWTTKTKAGALAGSMRAANGNRDKPAAVLSVHDNGGTTADRYTVVLDPKHGFEKERSSGLYQCIGLSSNPNSPQGFSQFSSCMRGRHLGRRVKWSALPANIREHIKGRLA
jgi:hypothetical protein